MPYVCLYECVPPFLVPWLSLHALPLNCLSFSLSSKAFYHIPIYEEIVNCLVLSSITMCHNVLLLWGLEILVHHYVIKVQQCCLVNSFIFTDLMYFIKCDLLCIYLEKNIWVFPVFLLLWVMLQLTFLYMILGTCVHAFLWNGSSGFVLRKHTDNLFFKVVFTCANNI